MAPPHPEGFPHPAYCGHEVWPGSQPTKIDARLGPAGTTLELLILIVLINYTAYPGEKQACCALLSIPLRSRKPIVLSHAKLVDDATIGESVSLDKLLVKKSIGNWVSPVTFHSRYHLVLPLHIT